MILKIILIILIAIPSITAFGVLFLLCRRPLVRFYHQRTKDRDFCPYNRIPAEFLHFILNIEDDSFFSHHGFCFDAIKTAIRCNKRASKIIMGGSTITQQLIKNIYFRFEHNYVRKFFEAILTFYAECTLKKERILELYINIIYYGNGQYGIVDAAEFYFNKRVDELSTNQQFMLACMPFAPTVANPLKHPDVFLRVRDRRINSLIKKKSVTEDEMQCVRQYDADCLDPGLRICGEAEQSFSEEIVLVNERFGLAKK